MGNGQRLSRTTGRRLRTGLFYAAWMAHLTIRDGGRHRSVGREHHQPGGDRGFKEVVIQHTPF